MAGRLPELIVPGWGYCIAWGFEPSLPYVPFNHRPSIVSNDICFNTLICLKYACTQYIFLICIYMCFFNVPYVIDPIIWLEETLSYFGVEGVDVESFDVDNGRLVQSRISFSIAARRGTGVVQISEVKVKASEKKVVVVVRLVRIQCTQSYTNRKSSWIPTC
jgi:hypothetical protein